MSFFVSQKFFPTFIKIRNIEIRNRLLWVRWYHGNSTFQPYWNAKMPSFAQYELIKPRERPAIWCIRTFPWYHITQRGCCEFQYCGNTHFPAISILSGQNHIIVQGCACLFLLIVNWPFKKVKMLSEAMIGLEKSFLLIYSNTHLRTRETLPLKKCLTRIKVGTYCCISIESSFQGLGTPIIKFLFH